MTPRRVVHYVDSEVFGGTEQEVLTLFEGLDRSKWDVVLAHRASPEIARLVEGARSLGVETWQAPVMRPGAAGLARIPRFTAELRRQRASLMHLHLTWPLDCQYALIGAVLARVPAVVATVQLSFDMALSRRVMLQQRLLTHSVDRYLAVSESVRRHLIRDLSWPTDKIDVVPNAVWQRPADLASATPLRQQIIGCGSGPLVLVPARLHEQKGHRYLMQAIPDVPSAHFALAGDGPERQALQSLTRELGIESRVSFLGQRDDIPDLLAAADLVVLPSLYEGLPVSLLEAMAAARPVIATRIGGTDELVESGHNGILVEPKNPRALADAIRSLLADPHHARNLALTAQQTIADRFSAEAMCARVSHVYSELISG